MGMDDSTMKHIEDQKSIRTLIGGIAMFLVSIVAGVTYCHKLDESQLQDTSPPAVAVPESDDAANKEVLQDIKRIIDDSEASVKVKAYIVASYVTRLRTKACQCENCKKARKIAVDDPPKGE